MRILYVDDDSEDGEVFCEAINEIDSSIHCTVCIKYTEVMQYLTGPCPDLVFLDYRMPIIDGKQILKTFHNHECFPKMKIIMYSTMMTDRDKEECRKLGAFDCIQKTGDFKALCAQISAIVSSRPQQ